ncbi:MAG: thiol peroxidase [Candidatus Omnitrophica bacterium]|nr:thiol peroxidase [Candidatus Omnitrophota bacterium]
MERKNAVTMKGNPITLLGDEIKVGQAAPNFVTLNDKLEDVALDKYKNKIKLISSVPSLDTPICDLQIKRFNDEATNLSKDIVILFISMDLPFAQKRFCQAYDIKKVKTLSDHRDSDFGLKYGVLIKELRLLTRAIFIIDKEDVVRYVEYVKEIASHPDYDAALAALKELVK